MNFFLKYKHIILVFMFLLVFPVVISYSWMPVLFSIPLLILLQFNLFKLKIINIVFAIYALIILMILVTINNQIIYIEWARNLLFIPLIVVSYFIGNLLAENDYYVRKTFLFFLFSAIFLVLYTFIFIVPLDLSLFFGERRGYIAQEFLLFGRKYEFSMGVTHLNMYINLVIGFLFVCLVFEKKRYLNLTIGFFLVLSLLTQSRSPVLFFLIVSFIYMRYKFQESSQKLPLIVISVFLLVLLASFIMMIMNLNTDGNQTRFTFSGFSDISRLLFFIKGIEHMILEPWGNSLLYSDERMPLLNYHNTFIAIGNRMGLVSFFALISLFFILVYRVRGVKNKEMKTAFYIITYFCFHNFMIEDVIKFDGFIIFIFLIFVPYVRRYYFIQERNELNV